MGVPEKLHVEHVILDYFNEHSDKKSITYDTISKITEEIINALQQRDISVYPDFNKDTEVEMAIIDHEIFEHDSVNRIVSIKKSIFRR